MQVYVVIGSTGEYSDRDEWPVAAYLDEDSARQHVEHAEAWSNVLQDASSNPWYVGRGDRENPYDPYFKMDYTGTFYHYQTVNTFSTFTDYLKAQESDEATDDETVQAG